VCHLDLLFIIIFIRVSFEGYRLVAISTRLSILFDRYIVVHLSSLSLWYITVGPVFVKSFCSYCIKLGIKCPNSRLAPSSSVRYGVKKCANRPTWWAPWRLRERHVFPTWFVVIPSWVSIRFRIKCVKSVARSNEAGGVPVWHEQFYGGRTDENCTHISIIL